MYTCGTVLCRIIAQSIYIYIYTLRGKMFPAFIFHTVTLWSPQLTAIIFYCFNFYYGISKYM